MFEGQRTTYKSCFSPSTVWVLRLSCPDYTHSEPKFESHHPIRLHGKFLFLLSHLASPLLFSEIVSLAGPGGHWLVSILAGWPVLTPAVPCSHGAEGLNHPNDDLLLSHLFVFLFPRLFTLRAQVFYFRVRVYTTVVTAESFETGVINGGEIQCGCWEPNSGPLQEH